MAPRAFARKQSSQISQDPFNLQRFVAAQDAGGTYDRAIGELRRYILDRMRLGKTESCESLLADMDEIYALLITLDYPDAITGNLRRTTDAARGILEKTRGDLTIAVGQAQLQRAMLALQHDLKNL